MNIQNFDDFISEKMKIIPISNDDLNNVSDHTLEMSNDMFMLKEIKLNDLRCFDLLKVKNNKCFVFMTNLCGEAIFDLDIWMEKPNKNHSNYDCNAFWVNPETHRIEYLGIHNFDQNLHCRINHYYDIVSVYRCFSIEKYIKMDFYEIYNDLKRKLKHIKQI